MITFIPSIYAHIFNGLLLLTALLLLYKNFNSIKKIESYKLVNMALLFSIAIGIHGLSHLGLEKGYNYTPYNIFKNLIN